MLIRNDYGKQASCLPSGRCHYNKSPFIPPFEKGDIGGFFPFFYNFSSPTQIDFLREP